MCVFRKGGGGQLFFLSFIHKLHLVVVVVVIGEGSEVTGKRGCRGRFYGSTGRGRLLEKEEGKVKKEELGKGGG